MEKLIRDGVSLAFQESGSGDPPLLFVHGWTCDHTFFAPQAAHFSVDHRAIAVDLRGHGESDAPQQDHTPALLADDLTWLCERRQVERPVVVGRSMGGVVCLVLAARYPDLPAAVIMVDMPTSPIVGPPQRGGPYGE